MKKLIICPYNSSCSGQCTHRGTIPSHKNKRYCGYKNYYNCELFIEWVKKSRKSKIEGREHIKSGMEEKDDSS